MLLANRQRAEVQRGAPIRSLDLPLAAAGCGNERATHLERIQHDEGYR
jgi:hypothetical protein